jgi:hypothetical protein
MTKLKGLSAQALADLLGLPLDKARAWLEVAASVPEEPSWVRELFDFAESSTFLLRGRAVDVLDDCLHGFFPPR